MKYVIANWKMNMDETDVQKWFANFRPAARENVKIIIAPPIAYLSEVKAHSIAIKIDVAGQDVSQFECGAHTGELAAFELKDFANYCIVGHSERHESQEITIKKINMCLAHAITPIVCFVDRNLLNKISQLESCIVCWEDPQNISKNGVYAPKNISEVSREVANIKKVWPNIHLLYGGSVNRQNARELANISELDGVLVGNASLDPVHFIEIVQTYE